MCNAKDAYPFHMQDFTPLYMQDMLAHSCFMKRSQPMNMSHDDLYLPFAVRCSSWLRTFHSFMREEWILFILNTTHKVTFRPRTRELILQELSVLEFSKQFLALLPSSRTKAQYLLVSQIYSVLFPKAHYLFMVYIAKCLVVFYILPLTLFVKSIVIGSQSCPGSTFHCDCQCLYTFVWTIFSVITATS